MRIDIYRSARSEVADPGEDSRRSVEIGRRSRGEGFRHEIASGSRFRSFSRKETCSANESRIAEPASVCANVGDGTVCRNA